MVVMAAVVVLLTTTRLKQAYIVERKIHCITEAKNFGVGIIGIDKRFFCVSCRYSSHTKYVCLCITYKQACICAKMSNQTTKKRRSKDMRKYT